MYVCVCVYCSCTCTCVYIRVCMHVCECWYLYACSVLCNMHTTLSAFIKVQMRYDGMVGFPGGTVDKGESPEMAVNREICKWLGCSKGQVCSYTSWSSVHKDITWSTKWQQVLPPFLCQRDQFRNIAAIGKIFSYRQWLWPRGDCFIR